MRLTRGGRASTSQATIASLGRRRVQPQVRPRPGTGTASIYPRGERHERHSTPLPSWVSRCQPGLPNQRSASDWGSSRGAKMLGSRYLREENTVASEQIEAVRFPVSRFPDCRSDAGSAGQLQRSVSHGGFSVQLMSAYLKPRPVPSDAPFANLLDSRTHKVRRLDPAYPLKSNGAYQITAESES